MTSTPLIDGGAPHHHDERLRSRRTLLLRSLGFFLITLDILIVNIALTRIGRELGGTTAS